MFGCVGIIGIYSGFLWQVLSCPILYKRFPLIFSSTKGSRWSSKISMTSKISPWEYRRYRSSQVPSVFVRARCSHSCVFRRGSCAQSQRPGPDNEETIYSHPVSYLMVLWLMCSLYIYIYLLFVDVSVKSIYLYSKRISFHLGLVQSFLNFELNESVRPTGWHGANIWTSYWKDFEHPGVVSWLWKSDCTSNVWSQGHIIYRYFYYY